VVLVTPWWMGISVDHMYEECPARQRSEPELKRTGHQLVGSGWLDPEDTDVCGWCLRVWKARQLRNFT
jgi:hypothetical protein